MGEIDDQEADDSLEAGGDQPDEGVEKIEEIDDQEADDSWGAAGDEPEADGTGAIVDNPGWKVGDQAIARYRKSNNSRDSNKCIPTARSPQTMSRNTYCKS